MEKYIKVVINFPDPEFCDDEEVFTFLDENSVWVIAMWIDLIEGSGGVIDTIYRERIGRKSREKSAQKVDMGQVESENLKPDLKDKDVNHPLYGNKILFTGRLDNIDRNEAAKAAKNCGADVNTSISKNTNYVVVGHDAGWKKLEKIENLQNAGCSIRVLSELEFLDMINLETTKLLSSSELKK